MFTAIIGTRAVVNLIYGGQPHPEAFHLNLTEIAMRILKRETNNRFHEQAQAYDRVFATS